MDPVLRRRLVWYLLGLTLGLAFWWTGRWISRQGVEPPAAGPSVVVSVDVPVPTARSSGRGAC